MFRYTMGIGGNGIPFITKRMSVGILLEKMGV